MPQDQVVVAHLDLSSFIARVLCRKGMKPLDAAAVADTLIWADLRGVDGHGVARLPRYLEFIQRGDLDPRAEPEIALETPALFVLNAKRAAGAVAMKIAVAEACKRAKSAGACFGLVRETTHVGAIGRYAHEVAENGQALFMAAAGPPLMAYHGTNVPSLSTSPIAIGVPGGESEPIVLDMATSTVSMGKIKQARARGQSIPEGWAIPEEETSAGAGVVLLPVGGPKGSGLSLMIELLTSILSGAPILSGALGPEPRKRHLQNAFLLVLDIATFRSVTGFRQDAENLASTIKRLPLRNGFEEISIPGERGRNIELVRRRTGIPIPATIWRELTQIAEAEAIEPPAIFDSAAPENERSNLGRRA